jgi:hypothetical protein
LFKFEYVNIFPSGIYRNHAHCSVSHNRWQENLSSRLTFSPMSKVYPHSTNSTSTPRKFITCELQILEQIFSSFYLVQELLIHRITWDLSSRAKSTRRPSRRYCDYSLKTVTIGKWEHR